MEDEDEGRRWNRFSQYFSIFPSPLHPHFTVNTVNTLNTENTGKITQHSKKDSSNNNNRKFMYKFSLSSGKCTDKVRIFMG